MRSLIYSGRAGEEEGKKKRRCARLCACVCLCARGEGSSKTRVPGEIEVFSVLLCKPGTSPAPFTHPICRGLKKIIHSAFRELINQLLAAQSIPQLWRREEPAQRVAACGARSGFELGGIFLVGRSGVRKKRSSRLSLPCAEKERGGGCAKEELKNHQGDSVTGIDIKNCMLSHLP